jgi:hypothetical protein
MRHAVAFDHIAEEHGVHVALQELDPRRRGHALCFGEPALHEVLAKAFLDQRPFGRRPAPGLFPRLLAAMTQELPKAEGPDDRRHSATTQRSMDLSRKHPRRGPGDGDFDLLGVEHSADEALPPWYELDFFEEPVHGLPPAHRRVAAAVLLEQEAELLEVEAGQAIIVETQIDGPLGRPRRPAFGEQLTKERGLPRAAHSDHRVHLAGHRGQSGVAPGERERRYLHEGSAQLLGKDRVKVHRDTLGSMCPSIKDTFGTARS